jgi:23S rRNA (uracil1939-C5)-methyltransferase
MVHGGGCLSRTDEGDHVLVDGAIPGELVEAELTRRRGGAWWARTAAVLEASPHRVAPPCAYVPECGGCDLQHVDYAHQLELKRGIVEDALRRHGVTPPDGLAVHGMEHPWRYRRRGEFHVVPGAQGMRDAGLGFNRARSWTPIAVEDCLIHDVAITESLELLRTAVQRGADDRLTVLQLTAGEGGAELLVRPRPVAALDPVVLDETAAQAPRRWMTDSTTLRWRDRDFRVRPETFVQVNQAQMEVVYACVLDGLGNISGRRLVDAYAGIGILACVLADRAAEVICIEDNVVAARTGMLNARLCGVEDRLRYVAQPVEAALAEVAAAAPVDAVILDPPRAGCASSVTGWLALAGPPQLAYVSCDPATLARDLHVLVASGPYLLERLDIVDMFPQTHHVECVALLRRVAEPREDSTSG